MMKFAKAVSCAVLALVVSACWVSDDPLLTSANSEMPMIDGSWALTGGNPDKVKYYSLSKDSTAKRFLARYRYGSAAQDSKDYEYLSFDQINGSWYVVQKVDTLGKVVGYQIASVSPARILLFNPVCNSTITSIKGVYVSGDDCDFATADALHRAGEVEVKRLSELNGPASETYIRQ